MEKLNVQFCHVSRAKTLSKNRRNTATCQTAGNEHCIQIIQDRRSYRRVNQILESCVYQGPTSDRLAYNSRIKMQANRTHLKIISNDMLNIEVEFR